MELQIQNLSKVYKNGVRALDNVSLTIPVGMYGLLGPNGAGKSTLMRTIATLQEPDSGQIHLGTLDVLRAKAGTAQDAGLSSAGVWRVSADLGAGNAQPPGAAERHHRREAAQGHGRSAAATAPISTSIARRRCPDFRAACGSALALRRRCSGNPRLLIVDEPTAGLDPGERNRFYSLLSEIGEDVIVILSTHIVEDVMELCTNMAIIHQGKVLFAGAPSDAVKSLEGRIWQKSVAKSEVKDYEQRYRVISSKLIAGKPLIHIYSAENPGDGFTPVSADLEDVFFSRISGIA